MPSPFPGMDPYLERPGLWPDVHVELISSARAMLGGQLRPKYVVRLEERVYVDDEDEGTRRISDVQITTRDEVHEVRMEVLERETRTVVTVIEILSPSNKRKGSNGWASFTQKRQEVMDSESHWVEIDLLRAGVRVWTSKPPPPCEYLVHVSRVDRRPEGLIYPIRLSQRLPSIPIPLRPEDPDAPLDLQAVLAAAYDRAGYDLSVDYSRDPVPPLTGEWAGWADGLLGDKGLRAP